MSTHPPNLCKVPLYPHVKNPSGAPPNFDNPTTFQPISIGVLVPFEVLATLAVIVRFWQAFKVNNKLKLDDYCCLAALILGYPLTILSIIMNKQIKHTWDMPMCFALNVEFMKMNSILWLLAPFTYFTAKTAISTMYLRVFGTITWLRRTVFVVLVFVYLIAITQIIYTIILKFPYGHQTWPQVSAKESSTRWFSIFEITVAVVTDIVLISIPISPIMKLNLSLRKRIGMTAIFAAGFLATSFALMNLVYRVKYYYTGDNGDKIWHLGMLAIATCMEQRINVIVACIPGCMSAWRNIIRDSRPVVKIRSILPHRSVSTKMAHEDELPSFVRRIDSDCKS